MTIENIEEIRERCEQNPDAVMKVLRRQILETFEELDSRAKEIKSLERKLKKSEKKNGTG